jgi:hypothetical protein
MIQYRQSQRVILFELALKLITQSATSVDGLAALLAKQCPSDRDYPTDL